jgi:hypothetical protein
VRHDAWWWLRTTVPSAMAGAAVWAIQEVADALAPPPFDQVRIGSAVRPRGLERRFGSGVVVALRGASPRNRRCAVLSKDLQVIWYRHDKLRLLER